MLANNIAFHNIEATGAAAISVYNKSNEYMNTARFSIDRIYE